jgi:hypothetical protein
MILKKVGELSNVIKEYRRNMIDLAAQKGLNHPDVLIISEKLDEKIIILQKILSEEDSSIYDREYSVESPWIN